MRWRREQFECGEKWGHRCRTLLCFWYQIAKRIKWFILRRGRRCAANLESNCRIQEKKRVHFNCLWSQPPLISLGLLFSSRNKIVPLWCLNAKDTYICSFLKDAVWRESPIGARAPIHILGTCIYMHDTSFQLYNLQNAPKEFTVPLSYSLLLIVHIDWFALFHFHCVPCFCVTDKHILQDSSWKAGYCSCAKKTHIYQRSGSVGTALWNDILGLIWKILALPSSVIKTLLS